MVQCNKCIFYINAEDEARIKFDDTSDYRRHFCYSYPEGIPKRIEIDETECKLFLSED